MSTNEPSEEELRAAYEEQIKQVRIEHVLLDNAVMMVNLGMRRTGLMPGTESERDVGQVQLAIDSVRALMPMLESAVPEQAKQIRQALSQLQMAYVQLGGSEPAGEGAGAGEGERAGPGSAPEPGSASRQDRPGTGTTEPASQQPPAADPGKAGPAQRSGRLWVPGQ
jgi:hypothetical protein